MINRMTAQPTARTVIVGVDTHKQAHVAVAIDTCGMRLGDHSFVADASGYQALLAWAETYGPIEVFGIEGTGGYGVGLARAVRRAGHRVLEVNRGDRRLRRVAGKSDTIDAEAAARSVLAGQATATPKTADGAVEMMRQLKVARDTAVKARHRGDEHAGTQIIINAPSVVRESLHGLTDQPLLPALRQPPPGAPRYAHRVRETHPAGARPAAGSPSLRKSRRMTLTSRASTTQTSPTLRAGFGVGANTAAELLIVFGDNPERIRSEAAFAKLCGACPIPASSGRTTGRHRLYRGGHRQANAALYRSVIVRMRYHQPNGRLRRATYGGRPDETGDHPVPQTVPRSRDLPAGHDRLPRSSRRHRRYLNVCLDI